MLFDTKYSLYRQGVDKLEKEFDILRYLRKIRVANSVANLTLKKYQKMLIPFFDKNILKIQDQSTSESLLFSKNLLKS